MVIQHQVIGSQKTAKDIIRNGTACHAACVLQKDQRCATNKSKLLHAQVPLASRSTRRPEEEQRNRRNRHHAIQAPLPFRNCILCFQRTYYLVLYNHDELTLLHPVRPASCTFRPLLDSCNTTNSAPHRFPFLAVICSPSNRSIEPSIARLHGKPFQSVDRAFHSEITWQALPIVRSCRPDGCAPPPTGA